MLVNKDILKAASAYRSQKHLSDERREYIAMLADEYEIACVLSIGDDDLRSAYWHIKAGERRNRLCVAIGYTERNSELTACRGA